MPRMKKFDGPTFPSDVPQEVRALDDDGNNITGNLDNISHTVDEQLPELKRLRFSNELILGDEVDVPDN